MSDRAPDAPARTHALRDFVLHVLPALLWVVLVFVGGGSHAPQPELGLELPIDKIEHVLAFLIMQALAYRALRFAQPEQSRLSQAWLGALVAAAVGIALELYQLGLPHRSAELADVVADGLGAGLGALLLGRRS